MAATPTFMPPGGPLEIVFTFDTTGSMYSVLDEVRAKLQQTIERLFTDIPALKIGVIAHGDYCDSHKYVTKIMHFSNDVKSLCDFVKTVDRTGGGDFEECYELVLRQCRDSLSWTAGTQRAVVMIGDAIPHPKNDPQNKLKLDWKEEAQLLHSEQGARIYSVQAYSNITATSFWTDLATLTRGTHLTLQKMESIVDIMMAICYREHGAEFFEAYEHEVRAREGTGISKDLHLMLGTLRDAPVPSTASTSKDEVKDSPKVKAVSTVKASHKSSVAPKVKAATPKVKVTPKVKAALTPKPNTRRSGYYLRARKAVDFKKRRTMMAAKKFLKKAVQTSLETDSPTYTLGKAFRESVPETKFALNDLSWTPWSLALADEAPIEEDSQWSVRGGDKVGVRKPALFPTTQCKAVYEFAVQPETGSRKYPVYFRTTGGFNQHNWDSYLLKNPAVKRQVNHVLKKGCKLYVRRARVEKEDSTSSATQELKKLIQDTYDYAWDKSTKSGRREVLKKGKLISAPSMKIEA